MTSLQCLRSLEKIGEFEKIVSPPLQYEFEEKRGFLNRNNLVWPPKRRTFHETNQTALIWVDLN